MIDVCFLCTWYFQCLQIIGILTPQQTTLYQVIYFTFFLFPQGVWLRRKIWILSSRNVEFIPVPSVPYFVLYCVSLYPSTISNWCCCFNSNSTKFACYKVEQKKSPCVTKYFIDVCLTKWLRNLKIYELFFVSYIAWFNSFSPEGQGHWPWYWLFSLINGIEVRLDNLIVINLL